MVYKIIWQPTALRTYIRNIEYLETAWTEKEVKRFIGLVEKKLESISRMPRLGILTGKRNNVRRVVIHKRIVLFYKHKPLKGEIDLLLFWNTYQEPGRLKY